MSLQFSRSLRILRLDSFRLARFGMLLAILLMGGLLAWFFLAKVTLFENSSSLQFHEDGRITATFSDEGIQRIQVGQAAILRLNTAPDQPSMTLEAAVYDLLPDSKQVELVVMPNEFVPQTLGSKPSGRVEVEVEYVTPAQLLMRATGKALNQIDIPLSPQKVQPGEGAEGS